MKGETSLGELERRAEELRSRLVSTVGVLDRRAKATLATASRIGRPFRRYPIIIAASAGTVLVGGIAAMWFASGAIRARRRRRERWVALSRWSPVAPPPRLSYWRSLALVILGAAAGASGIEFMRIALPLVGVGALRRVAGATREGVQAAAERSNALLRPPAT